MKQNTLFRYLRLAFPNMIMLITLLWFAFTPNLVGDISEVITNHLSEDLSFITNDAVKYVVMVVWLSLLTLSLFDTGIRVSNKNNKEQTK